MKDKMVLKLERDRLLTKSDTMAKTVDILQKKITSKKAEENQNENPNASKVSELSKSQKTNLSNNQSRL